LVPKVHLDLQTLVKMKSGLLLVILVLLNGLVLGQVEDSLPEDVPVPVEAQTDEDQTVELVPGQADLEAEDRDQAKPVIGEATGELDPDADLTLVSLEGKTVLKNL